MDTLGAFLAAFNSDKRHRDLARRVEAVVQEMDASGELARLREALVKQVLNEP